METQSQPGRSGPADAELVHYGLAAGIATITLDSPANRNALSQQLVAQLLARLEQACAGAADGSVRVIVLAHTGKVFCAGADLLEAGAQGVAEGAENLAKIMRCILSAPVPVVARVDGVARAGGLGILGAADIVVAQTAATFAFSEVRIGLGPAIISLTTMGRMSSRSVSRYYLTGESFDAVAAQECGLITCAAEDVDGALEPILKNLRLGAPQGLAESKKVAAAPMLAQLDAGVAEMTALSTRLFTTDQVKEGMAAFLERRQPSWQLPTS